MGKVSWVRNALYHFVPILDVFVEVFHPGVEDVGKRVLAQVLHRKDAVGLSVGVVLVQPQRPQLHDCVQIAPQPLQGMHEVGIVHAQVVEDCAHVIIVSLDEVDDCLSVIFGDVLGFTHMGASELSRVLIIWLVGVFLAGRGFLLLR